MASVIVAVRVHAGTNNKDRPTWFSKETCLTSLQNSIDGARAAGVDVWSIAFVDEAGGKLPEPLREIVQHFNEIVEYRAGSSRKSWQRHLRLLRRNKEFLSSNEETVVYLVEDDHLHHPDAISALVSPPGDYYLLYSLSKQHQQQTTSSAPWIWVPTMRGVSSFALSKNTLVRDHWLLSVMSNAGPAFDLLTWQAVRGRSYFSISEVFAPFNPKPPFEPTSALKAGYQVMWRIIANLLSALRSRRVISATSPSLATHSENSWLAPDMNWNVIAREVKN